MLFALMFIKNFWGASYQINFQRFGDTPSQTKKQAYESQH